MEVTPNQVLANSGLEGRQEGGRGGGGGGGLREKIGEEGGGCGGASRGIDIFYRLMHFHQYDACGTL